MSTTYPLPAGRNRLGELVARARQGNERVILTDRGEPVAAIISFADLVDLQHAEDAADIAVAEARKASDSPLVPHDEVVALMQELDAAEGLPTAER